MQQVWEASGVPGVQAVVEAARTHRPRLVQVQEEPAALVALVVVVAALLLLALALELVALVVVGAVVLEFRTRAPARPHSLSFPRLKAKAAGENRILVLPLVPRSLPETNPQPHLVP